MLLFNRMYMTPRNETRPKPYIVLMTTDFADTYAQKLHFFCSKLKLLFSHLTSPFFPPSPPLRSLGLHVCAKRCVSFRTQFSGGVKPLSSSHFPTSAGTVSAFLNLCAGPLCGTMSNTEAADTITVETLQKRLRELRTLWQTTKLRDSRLNDVREDDKIGSGGGGASKSNNRNRSCNDLTEKAVAASESSNHQPTKPPSPPLHSSRPLHTRAPSMEAALTSSSGNRSRESTASLGIPFSLHTPSTLSTGSPRARQKAAWQVAVSTTPERASLESLTLPPLQSHGAPAALTCPQCNARVVSFASRCCSVCGVQLSTV